MDNYEGFRKMAQAMGYSPAAIDEYLQKKQMAAQENEQQQLMQQMKLQQQMMNMQLTQKKLEEQLNPTPTETPQQKGEAAAVQEIAKQKKLSKAGITSGTTDKEMKKLSDIEDSINLLERNYKDAEIKGPLQGDLATLLSNITRGSMYPNVKTYEDLRKSLIGPLARAISGEVGVLTDKDIARAEGLLPKINEDSDVVKKKLKNLKDTLANRSGRKTTSGAKTPTTDIESLRKKYNY